MRYVRNVIGEHVGNFVALRNRIVKLSEDNDNECFTIRLEGDEVMISNNASGRHLTTIHERISGNRIEEEKI
jgi:hypothetical protein